MQNKRVLLRERKRHTARRVAKQVLAMLGGVSGLGGYPIPGLGGYPIPGPGRGVPHPRSRKGGTPSQVREGGYPIPGPGGVPVPGLGGYPILTWLGYPPGQTWDGLPPLPRPEMGYPPYIDLGWGNLTIHQASKLKAKANVNYKERLLI